MRYRCDYCPVVGTPLQLAAHQRLAGHTPDRMEGPGAGWPPPGAGWPPPGDEWQVSDPGNYGRARAFEQEEQALAFAANLAVLHMTVVGKVDGRSVLVMYPNGAIVEVAARMIRRPT